MEIIDIKESIYKFKIESHSEIKQTILNQIAEIETTPSNNDTDIISHQDFFLPKDMERKYMDTFYPSLIHSLDILSQNYNRELNVNNFWFQQYNYGDTHTWHRHANCNYSSVYYVECPEGMSTSFMIRDEIIDIPASEGDYIIFPSTLYHCSKPNFTNQRKTVIAVNLNYQEN